MASKSSGGRAAQQAGRRIKREAAKKKNRAYVVLFLLFLVLGIAAGGACAYFMTAHDGFYLREPETLVITAGDTYRLDDLGSDCYAVSFGRDVSDRVTFTTTFDVAEDGTVTPSAGTYYITYSMPAFGNKEVVRIRTVVVEDAAPADPAEQEGGVGNG